MGINVSEYIIGKFAEIQARVPVTLNGFTVSSGSAATASAAETASTADAATTAADAGLTADASTASTAQNASTSVFAAELTQSLSGQGATATAAATSAGTATTAGVRPVIFPNIVVIPEEEETPPEGAVDAVGAAGASASATGQAGAGGAAQPLAYTFSVEEAYRSAAEKNIEYLNKYGDAEIQQMIEDAIATSAAEYSVDPNLIKAVIMQESSFSPVSLSSAGAQGLMQLMPDTADALGVQNPWNIYDNIDGGTRLLKQYLISYAGDLSLVLSAYNAGPGAVEKYGGIPPYEETQDYVKKVVAYYDRYRQNAAAAAQVESIASSG